MEKFEFYLIWNGFKYCGYNKALDRSEKYLINKGYLVKTSKVKK